MSNDLRDIRPIDGALFGTLFLAAGLMILSIAFEWIYVDPASIHAPRWVLGICGVMFLVPGVVALYFGVRNGRGGGARSGRRAREDAFSVVGWLTGLVISGGMTVVAGWIAFGPGERAFSGSVGVGGVAVGGSGQSETVGRWVFGICAVLVGLFTVWGLVYGVRRLLGGREGFGS
ncbi:MAG: hypothetical protein ACODAB_04965 [Gemmatimonadota bacterium]